MLDKGKEGKKVTSNVLPNAVEKKGEIQVGLTRSRTVNAIKTQATCFACGASRRVRISCEWYNGRSLASTVCTVCMG